MRSSFRYKRLASPRIHYTVHTVLFMSYNNHKYCTVKLQFTSLSLHFACSSSQQAEVKALLAGITGLPFMWIGANRTHYNTYEYILVYEYTILKYYIQYVLYTHQLVKNLMPCGAERRAGARLLLGGRHAPHEQPERERRWRVHGVAAAARLRERRLRADRDGRRDGREVVDDALQRHRRLRVRAAAQHARAAAEHVERVVHVDSRCASAECVPYSTSWCIRYAR